jgi:hypothetical protein
MPFQKGNTHGQGRPKGAANKVTSASRELFVTVMEGEMSHIQEELAVLRENSPEKYLKALSGLLPYFMPKQSETEIFFNETVTPPSWFDEVIERESPPEENPLIK